MGGFAAKQRRRLERQSLQPPEGYYNDKDNDDEKKKSSSKSKMTRNNSKDLQRGTYQSSGNKNNNVTTTTSKGNKHDSTTILKAKKKIQKPKHLKRKLESITSNNINDDNSNLHQEKEQLLKQMEELERRKRQKYNSTQNVTTTTNIRKPTKVEKVPNRQTDDANNSMTNKVINKKQKQDTSLLAHSIEQKSKRIIKETNEVGITNQKSVVDVISNKVDISKIEMESSNIKDTLTINSKDDDNEQQYENDGINASNKNGAIVGDGANNTSNDKNDDDDDDDDDDDVLIGEKNIRQRGKRLRRRGQNKNDVKSTENEDTLDVDKSSNNTNEGKNTKSPNEDTNNTPLLRRCIGRKPVTDYVIGQCYSGTVVYVKPFGIFLDIGCHSDAFCHVSQLSDEFIQSPIDIYPIGSKIDNQIRVVSIDRKKKQLTVSLKQGGETTKTVVATSQVKGSKGKNKSIQLTDDRKDTDGNATLSTMKSTIVVVDDDKTNESNVENTKNKIHTLSEAEQAKRARKIARRALRRNERELTNTINQ